MENLYILADTLHTMLCDKPHGENMLEVLQERNPELCYYYLENSIVEKWNLADHLLWLKKAEDIIPRLNCRTSEDALQRLYKILDAAKVLSEFSAFELQLISALLHTSSAPDG